MMGTEQFHFRERHQKLSQKMPLALSLSHLFTPLQFLSFSLSLSPSVSPSFSLSQSLSPSLSLPFSPLSYPRFYILLSLLPLLKHFFSKFSRWNLKKVRELEEKRHVMKTKHFLRHLRFFCPKWKKIWSVKKSLCISRDSLSHSFSFQFQFKISVWIFYTQGFILHCDKYFFIRFVVFLICFQLKFIIC